MGKTYFLSAVTVALVHFLTACIAMGVVTNLSTDQSALLALKAHITSDPLSILTNNWSTTTTSTAVCHWIGVICTTRHHRVAALVLSHMGLTGTIPPHIGNLSFLVQLDIYNNSFHGYLPQEMARLRRLKHIVVGDNKFGGLIPSWLGEISQLEILHFRNNSFTGNIPQEIGDLHNLRSLDMDSNQLTGFIPAAIFNISTLQLIDFSYNSLSGSLPVDICYRLSNLESLSLSQNEFDGLIPSRWNKCSQLQRLSLSYNKFRGPLPSEIGNSTMLTWLRLSGNNLEGEIPREIGNLNRLEALTLEEAGLSGHIPSSIFNISSLRFLALRTNNFVGSLPRDMCLHLPALEFLALQENELGGSIPSHIGNCTSLSIIGIYENKLTGVIPDEIGELPKIEELVLSFNNLSGSIPTTLFNSSTIQLISIVSNRLAGNLPSGQYLSLPNLKSLHLGNNTLTGTIPSIITNASQLTNLDLASKLIIRRRKRLKPPTLSDEFLPKTFERVTYQELLRATEGFSESNLLGIGSFGSVYKGILTNGTILAIKVFNLQVESAFKSFDTECEILRNIRHRNLTKVISSCSSPDFKALILEYMPNGNLEKWLYSHNYFLDISKKLEILIDVACALEYLHHGYSTPVLHLDLKPSNVLLDEDMVARVSDFGIAKFLGDDENAAHTKTIATLGYMAPGTRRLELSQENPGSQSKEP
ncbi:LRR receptor-like serine/threonine-protein kinase EFR isoform X2 [Actinidia eriantha]|uniref:LRR receptor-like serine/threonine-protein kinase EFR isoform X2 n=1 Tax=Actinidia eriantha TaxID=165200 RepID=UPI002587C1A2|nr:LRR receptor-like serine/threonine-protein kinase EFR isoform X2 [Actinidia eriantha]